MSGGRQTDTFAACNARSAPPRWPRRPSWGSPSISVPPAARGGSTPTSSRPRAAATRRWSSACAADDRVEALLALTGDATAGEALFTAACATCHGPGATGGSAPQLVSHFELDTVHIRAIVYGKEEMPAFGDLLSDQDIADVAAYLSDLR